MKNILKFLIMNRALGFFTKQTAGFAASTSEKIINTPDMRKAKKEIKKLFRTLFWIAITILVLGISLIVLTIVTIVRLLT